MSASLNTIDCTGCNEVYFTQWLKIYKLHLHLLCCTKFTAIFVGTKACNPASFFAFRSSRRRLFASSVASIFFIFALKCKINHMNQMEINKQRYSTMMKVCPFAMDFRYQLKTDPSVFTVLSHIKWAKFSRDGTVPPKISITVHISNSSTDLHSQ